MIWGVAFVLLLLAACGGSCRYMKFIIRGFNARRRQSCPTAHSDASRQSIVPISASLFELNKDVESGDKVIGVPRRLAEETQLQLSLCLDSEADPLRQALSRGG